MQRRQLEETSGGEGSRRERRKILVVGNGGSFSDDMVSYALHLAERLDYDIVALSVLNTAQGGDQLGKGAFKAAGPFRKKAAGRGIRCEHVIKLGDLGGAVEELNHEVKRIEFVVTDSEANREEVAREVTVPMFSVVSSSLEAKGGKVMASDGATPKGKLLAQTVGYGLVSAVLYAAVFLNAHTVMQYFTKGGLYAALPIATVFVFSFAHGAFASSLWSFLGIEAHKKDSLRQTKRKVIQKRKQAQKRPRAYAYVNPFHRFDK